MSLDTLKSWSHLVSIPSVVGYADRTDMFLALGRSFQYQTIFLRNRDLGNEILESQGPHVQFRVPRSELTGLEKFGRIWRVAEDVSKQKLIIHDTLQPALAVMNRLHHLRKPSNVRYFVSVYYPNTEFFKQRHRDEIWRNLDVGERRQYTVWYIRRMLDDWLSTRVADGVIGNSPEICSSLIAHYQYPEFRTCVIPGEINIGRYRRVENAREALGLPDIDGNSRIVLYVGSIQARKELPVLLRAVREARRSGENNLHLIICGSQGNIPRGHINEFPDVLGASPNVHFVGPKKTAELAFYYSAADCFVHPGRWEGSPRTIKEAMAYGCKVVAADISGTRVIDPEAKYISYFRPGDHKQLAETIIASMATQDTDRHQRQRHYLDNKFSPLVVAEQYARFYLRASSIF